MYQCTSFWLPHIYLHKNLELYSVLRDITLIHTLRKVIIWLENCSIKILDWPGHYTDLNPIYNIQQKLRMVNPHCRSIEELKRILRKSWVTKMIPELSWKFIIFITHWMKRMIKNNVCKTKYLIISINLLCMNFDFCLINISVPNFNHSVYLGRITVIIGGVVILTFYYHLFRY